jgi:hypothetical protein
MQIKINRPCRGDSSGATVEHFLKAIAGIERGVTA